MIQDAESDTASTGTDAASDSDTDQYKAKVRKLAEQTIEELTLKCPKCTTPSDRVEGCACIVCNNKYCKQVYCWGCFAMFDDEDKCYEHLQDAHGDGGCFVGDDVLRPLHAARRAEQIVKFLDARLEQLRTLEDGRPLLADVANEVLKLCPDITSMLPPEFTKFRSALRKVMGLRGATNGVQKVITIDGVRKVKVELRIKTGGFIFRTFAKTVLVYGWVEGRQKAGDAGGVKRW